MLWDVKRLGRCAKHWCASATLLVLDKCSGCALSASSPSPSVNLRGTQIIPSRIPALVLEVGLPRPFKDDQARLLKGEGMAAKPLYHVGVLFQGPVIGNKEVWDLRN